METVLDFIMAALPWLAMGLMLAIFAVRENSRKNNPEKEDNYGSEGMTLGMCFGTAIASAMKNSEARTDPRFSCFRSQKPSNGWKMTWKP